MKYIKYILEGFVEVIGLIPTSLILQSVLNIPNFLIKNKLVTISPIPIIVVSIVAIVIIITVMKQIFIESIKNTKTVTIKTIGWIIALFVIIFVFNNPLFSNLEVIPEVLIWLVVVGLGNLIAYYKNKVK